MELIRAYIDSFSEITVLVDKSIFNFNKEFYLESDSEKITLDVVNCYMENDSFYKIILRYNTPIILHKEYYISDNEKNRCLLKNGSIIREKKFDELYKYDGPLGVEYHKEYSIFRIWSPVAKSIYVKILVNNKEEKYFLEYNESLNVWEVKINKDLEGAKYLYYVRVFEDYQKMLDPYASSSGANRGYNYVIDLSKTYEMKAKKPAFSGRYTDSIIYEASIKDFTCNLDDDLNTTYQGMKEYIPYIKDLGVTHVQLLPTYDFEGVNDLKKNAKYNWGYNPVQYFVPSGYYSKNPDNPYSRINEYKSLIDSFNENGLRVILDVVYNHVYDDSLIGLDILVPGYAYRYDMYGNKSNATGCGNVLATERYMVRRLVIDNLVYLAKFYNVSGFRFDLMGLLDTETLNIAADTLKKLDPTIMLYGEGWDMDNPLEASLRPTSYNHTKIPAYAFFNDRFRDTIRGSQFNNRPGMAFNVDFNIFDLIHLVSGSYKDYYKFSAPYQSINYVECHDNYTFYDFGKYKHSFDDKEIYDAERLALSLSILSLGVPFIHAGSEFFRTKKGVENAYKSPVSVNKIDLKRMERFKSNIETVKDLIKIRKEYKSFRFNNDDSIHFNIHILEGLISNHTMAFILEETKCNLFVIIKNDYEKTNINMDDYHLLFDGIKLVKNKKLKDLSKPGIYIYRKEK